MEAASRILRHIHELGRGSPLRRVLERVADLPLRIDRSGAAIGPAPSVRRQDLFWEHARATTAPRMAAAAATQQNLFGWLALDAPPARDRVVKQVDESRTAAARPASRREALEKAPPAASVRKLRMPTESARYADRRRTVSGEAVARLLEVTRGVSGVERPPVFELPRGRFSARVDLWKGRPVGIPFIMGN